MEDVSAKQEPSAGQRMEACGVAGPRCLYKSSSPTCEVHSDEVVRRLHCSCCCGCRQRHLAQKHPMTGSECRWKSGSARECCRPQHVDCCRWCEDLPNSEEGFKSTVMRLTAMGVPLKRCFVEEADSGMIAATGFFLIAVATVLAFFGIYCLLFQRLLPLSGVGSPLDLGRDVYYASLSSCTIVTLVLFVYWNWLALKYFRQS